MNENERKLCKILRQLDEEDAVGWFKERFPPYDGRKAGLGMQIIGHRSWRRRSQIDLAHYYFENLGIGCALQFVPFMSIPLLISILDRYLPTDPKSLQKISYYLVPALRKNSRSDRDVQEVNRFVDMIEVMMDET